MGWLGKVIGGVVGGALGGPAGAAAGVALGAVADYSSTRIPTVGIDVLIKTDKFGLLFEITALDKVPEAAIGELRLLNEEGNQVKALKAFSDEDGFFTYAPMTNSFMRAYVPLGALGYKKPQKMLLVVKILAAGPKEGQFQYVGRNGIEIDMPKPPKFTWVEFIRPLVDMCMYIVRADGKTLPEEIRLVKTYLTEQFELSKKDMPDLQKAMKAVPLNDLNGTVSAIFTRLPMMDPSDLIGLMAGVAHCDGEIHPKEVELIREVALILGVPEHAWDEVRQAYELEVNVVDYYAILGVSEGSSLKEIHRAYRKLASDYHPDRVATLPKEFQEVAHQKMIEINEAYKKLTKE